MHKVVVPNLGESVAEATVLSINIKVGEYVEENGIVAELETDKVNIEVYAPVSGVVQEHVCSSGDSVLVGETILLIDNNAKAHNPPSQQKKDTNDKINEINNEKLIDIPPSPSAQRLAKANNIDISKIQGTGKHGQILKSDVIHKDVKCDSKSIDNNELVERVKMSKLRQTIARRLKDAQNEAAILTTFNEIDMSSVINLRNKYKEEFEKKHQIKIGFMSFFAKAVTIALKEIPTLNAEIENSDTIVYRNYCNIGFAVGTNNGLVVPVARHVENMSLHEIEMEISRLGQMAKDGKLAISDLRGATFTISNGGIYGSLMSTPILNPPQSGILGMHNIVRRAVVVGDEIVIRPMMYVALSYDHRIVDGKEAVTFLVRIKNILESPERILLSL